MAPGRSATGRSGKVGTEEGSHFSQAECHCGRLSGLSGEVRLSFQPAWLKWQEQMAGRLTGEVLL